MNTLPPQPHAEDCNRHVTYRHGPCADGKTGVVVRDAYLATLARFPGATAGRLATWRTTGWNYACHCGAVSMTVLDVRH